MALPPHLCRLIYLGLMSDNPEPPECSICYDKLKMNTFCSTVCGHYFCPLCLGKIDTCAVCRRRIEREFIGELALDHWHLFDPFAYRRTPFFELTPPRYMRSLMWEDRDIDFNGDTPNFDGVGVLRTPDGDWNRIYIDQEGNLAYNGQAIRFAPLDQLIVGLQRPADPQQLAIAYTDHEVDRYDQA